MTQLAQPLYIRDTDRLGMTLFFAVALHVIILLGISFDLPDPAPKAKFPTMDITLVHTRSDEEQKDAKLLAQANQAGGGDSDKPLRPQSPASAPTLIPDPGLAQMATSASAPTPQQRTDKDLLTQRESSYQLHRSTDQPEVQPTRVTAVQLMDQAMQMASLSTDISPYTQFESQKPRQKFVSARTRESKYVSYMEAWRAKVERIGNLNFPHEVRSRGLQGDLILDVALNANGTIHSINLLRSSGSKTLDDSAIRIVRLAAPYARFPEPIREETDVLHIIRTWQYLDGQQIFSR